MLRRSVCRAVHLLTALVPQPQVTTLPYLTSNQLTTATQALAERTAILQSIDLLTPLRSLTQDTMTRQTQRELIRQFGTCVDAGRAILYKKALSDPHARLQLHEAIMAAGFYERLVSPTELAGEPLRFVLNHYNFDVRRDVLITRRAHDSLLAEKETTPESETLLRDLLLLERRLFGSYRFAPTGGRRWLTLGLALSDLTTEAEVQRVLQLPVIAAEGNFTLSEADTEKLWKTLTLTPGAEETRSLFELLGLHQGVTAADTRLDLRVQKPRPPPDRWERIRETLLRYWVIWFSLWLMFWAVDEEIITILALIFMKHRQTKILEAEAAQSGGKIYLASSQSRNVK